MMTVATGIYPSLVRSAQRTRSRRGAGCYEENEQIAVMPVIRRAGSFEGMTSEAQY